VPIWTVVIGFVVGAVTGSFLNMVIYRLPRAISFINPSHSICPKCDHKLNWIDLIPLLSWLSTGGKCRYCKAPVAPRYFLVELLTGGLMAAAWHQFQIQSDRAVWMWFVWAMLACLVAVIFIDWELFIIPDELNGFILVLGFAGMLVHGRGMEALWGAVTGWGIMWFISFVLGRVILGKDALGDGDIKLMRGVGAMLGPMLTGASVILGVFSGLVIGVALMVFNRPEPSSETEPDETPEPIGPDPISSYLKRGVWYLFAFDVLAIFVPSLYKLIGEEAPPKGLDEEDTWEPSATTIPFGPYLALGAIICLLFGDSVEGLMREYLRLGP
jgi:leader peptidase (prepilin peptidase)/N-methyltransferase